MISKQAPEVNAGSMADIAFLLLIFFLVTTTMDVDKGLTRMLPPPLDPSTPPPPEIKNRNVFSVLINSRDQLLVKNAPGNIETLREQTKEFLLNPNNDPSLSEQPLFSERSSLSEKERLAYEILGDIRVSRGVISLQNDRGTSYDVYIKVQNELAAAINEIRNELAVEIFGVEFDKLRSEEQMEAIRTAVPMRISEAEPKDVGGNK
ncbi:MAG: biopolymer transporter ExbD [Bacteroidales bacterium]|nr:biopolymer transporter ExbD [Bacteroidales bacterium]